MEPNRHSKISFTVPDTPIPQGSKSISRTGHMYEANKKLGPWRNHVRLLATEAANTQNWEPTKTPHRVALDFRFTPPKTDPTREFHRTKPDVDKLARAVLDAITGPILVDDANVSTLWVHKGYVSPGRPEGVTITIDRG